VLQAAVARARDPVDGRIARDRAGGARDDDRHELELSLRGEDGRRVERRLAREDRNDRVSEDEREDGEVLKGAASPVQQPQTVASVGDDGEREHERDHRYAGVRLSITLEAGVLFSTSLSIGAAAGRRPHPRREFTQVKASSVLHPDEEASNRPEHAPRKGGRP